MMVSNLEYKEAEAYLVEVNLLHELKLLGSDVACSPGITVRAFGSLGMRTPVGYSSCPGCFGSWETSKTCNKIKSGYGGPNDLPIY